MVVNPGTQPHQILSTSNSHLQGVVHTTGGYLTYAALSHKVFALTLMCVAEGKHIFDYRPGDVYACVADVGWITGHTCTRECRPFPLTLSDIVYGPLANGATTLVFESVPTFPDAGRYWQVSSAL